jgi:hypothetical protein
MFDNLTSAIAYERFFDRKKPSAAKLLMLSRQHDAEIALWRQQREEAAQKRWLDENPWAALVSASVYGLPRV